jgi:hypothetical protein
MGLPVMNSAEWHREFITHLAPERGVLSKAEVMRIRDTAGCGQILDELCRESGEAPVERGRSYRCCLIRSEAREPDSSNRVAPDQGALG